MDTSDLRAELDRRADQMPPTASTPTRLAAVARRVRARRRRAVGGVAGLAAAGVGIGAFLVPDIGRNSTTQVEPAAPASTQATRASGSWPIRVDGNPLVLDRLTRQPVQSRTWTVTVPTLDLSVSMFCRLQPDMVREEEALRRGPIGSLRVNGQAYVGGSCGDSAYLGAQRPFAELDSRTMREYGVRAGEPFELTLTVGEDTRTAWRAQLGLGLYARTGEVREVAPGWSIPVVRGVPGDETSLLEVFTVPVRRQGGVLDVTLGQSGDPASELSFGWLVRSHQGSVVLTHDGVRTQQSTAGAVVSGVPFQDGRRIVVRTRGGEGRGTLLLAMYAPLADAQP